jgi:general stress protein YciG
MAGTRKGGLKAAAKNLTRDPDFYAKIGAKGGQNGRTGGFAANPELARIAGAKGGRISRRKKTVITVVTAQDDDVQNDQAIAA